MKLYDHPFAPNPMKVRVYLAEKGLSIPLVRVDIVKGEQDEPAFRAVNPLGAVPVLELDDGTRICQSLAILEYLEELHPEPPLIGRDPLERARVRELERTIDVGVLMRVGRIIHNTRSPLPGVESLPELAKREREKLPGVLRVVDERIGGRAFAAGDHPTIADCTLYAALRFAELGRVEIDPGCRNLHRWYATFRERPSARS